MTDVSATLRERAGVARTEAARLAARMERISVARLVTAAAIVVAVAQSLTEPRYRVMLASAAGVALVVFIVLVRATQQLDAKRRRAVAYTKVREQSALRAERAWQAIDAQPWTWAADAEEALRIDLDVVGRESLLQLLPTISSGVGAPLLRRWLSTLDRDDGGAAIHAKVDELRSRQAAIAQLRDHIDLREAFERCARRVWLDASRVDAFVEWGRVGGAPEPPWLRAASLGLPVVTIVSLAASPFSPAAVSLALLSLFVTSIVNSLVRARTREAIHAADVGAQFADAYAELAGAVLASTVDAPRLVALRAELDGGGARSRADQAFERLSRLSGLAEVRASPMMHVALQALLAWDCQIARAVDRWRAVNGRVLGAWFSAFGELECLAALASLAHANPEWSFPDLSSRAPLRVTARGLGHPLLPPEGRVANDVDLGPRGNALLISGSNMSGKSTLLRAIGLNLLLARAGGAVCAEAMVCPPVRLLTSMRLQDSLAEGMSYFMAEALRLRDIVFVAEAASDERPAVYLIDEILRGTNSEERAVAARYIVARLLETPAIGAITTHDLGVFDVAELAPRLHHAHFAERFEDAADDERLVFDYRLRPGPATSRNALRLLKVIGLLSGSSK